MDNEGAWVPFHEEQSGPEDEASDDERTIVLADDAPPLLRAALNGDLQAVRRELAAGVDPNSAVDPQQRFMSPMESVCYRSDNKRYRYADSPEKERDRVAIVEALIDAGVSPTELTETGWSFAHEAAYYERPQILAAIIKAAGTDAAALVNRRTDARWTALHYAATDGSIEMVRMLLHAGADVHPHNGMDNTALECAMGAMIPAARTRLYPLLLAAGATIPPDAHDAYLRKVRAAGGFKAYEKAHRQTLVTMAARCFPRLPVEVAAQVVAFAFHTGYY